MNSRRCPVLNVVVILMMALTACQGAGSPTVAPTSAPPAQSNPAVSSAPTANAPAVAPPANNTPVARATSPASAVPGGTPLASGTAEPMLPVPGVMGLIIYAKDGGLWVLEPATAALRQLATIPPRTYIGAPAVSPDGQRIVYSLYDVKRATEKKDNGTDLYIMTIDGQNQQLLLEHDIIGAWFSEPEWAPDGKTLLFTRRDTKGKESIERLTLQGAKRETLLAEATSPALTPDGKQLAYLVTDPQSYTQDLWIANADGSNPKRLLGDPDFEALVNPRISPDGQRIAFVGVGGPDQQPPRKAASIDSPAQPRLDSLLGRWLMPPTAQAHGIPYNIWTVKLDGTDLRRLTLDLEVELPSLAWSPDNTWLAFTSDKGLNAVAADGSALHFFGRDFAVGGMDWYMR